MYSLAINIIGQGKVTPASGKYISGSKILIKAVPEKGWSFDYWLGNSLSSNSIIVLKMDGDKSLTAIFKKEEI